MIYEHELIQNKLLEDMDIHNKQTFRKLPKIVHYYNLRMHFHY